MLDYFYNSKTRFTRIQMTIKCRNLPPLSTIDNFCDATYTKLFQKLKNNFFTSLFPFRFPLSSHSHSFLTLDKLFLDIFIFLRFSFSVREWSWKNYFHSYIWNYYWKIVCERESERRQRIRKERSKQKKRVNYVW